MEKRGSAGWNKSIVQIILWAIMLGIVASMFVAFSRDNRQRILEQNEIYVRDNTRQRAAEMERVLSEAKDQIEMMSFWLSKSLTSPTVTTDTLKELEEESSFDYVRFVNPEGVNISSDGRENDATDREYYLKGMAGNTGISVIMKSRITSETLVNFYTPVYYQEKIIGVLRGVFVAEERMKKLLESSFFGVEATTFLCTSDGTVIAGNGPDLHYGFEEGVRKLMLDDSNMDSEMMQRVMDAFRTGEDASFTYQDGKNTGNGYMTRLNVNDWFLLQTFPAQVTGDIYQASMRAGVRLVFPVAQTQQLPDKTPMRTAQTNTRGKRLLLVEDNELNREIALEILQEEGYRVETANDGDVAVEMVANSQPGYYDLVLMDIQMPTMDGLTATRLIRALPDPALAQIPIAAMTANAFDEDKQRSREAGMNAHIAKPLDIKQLLDTIAALLY